MQWVLRLSTKIGEQRERIFGGMSSRSSRSYRKRRKGYPYSTRRGKKTGSDLYGHYYTTEREKRVKHLKVAIHELLAADFCDQQEGVGGV